MEIPSVECSLSKCQQQITQMRATKAILTDSQERPIISVKCLWVNTKIPKRGREKLTKPIKPQKTLFQPLIEVIIYFQKDLKPLWHVFFNNL